MLEALFRRLLIVPAFGAILVSFSEFWFYEVGADVDHVLILLAYGILGYLALSIAERFRVRDFAGFFVTAALLGFLIEGVPVPVVYSGLPFTIVWTSLGWHALITICIGWVLFKHVMTRRSWVWAFLLNVAIGVFLAWWNAYLWNAVEDDATREVTFNWQPVSDFTDQFLLGYALFIVGHLVFERVYRDPARFHQYEHWGLWVLCIPLALLVAFASGLWLQSLALPILLLICLWALRRNARATRQDYGDYIYMLNDDLIPLWRYLLTLAIPGTAIPLYTWIVEQQIPIEANWPMIIVAGPISVGLFLWGVIKLGLRRPI